MASVRLNSEIALARAAGAASRFLGRGGGTTLPGKLLVSVDSGAIEQLAARLSDGNAVISATNGKTTTTAMVASILGPTRHLAHNMAGANLASGIASALIADRRAELGLFEVDEAAVDNLAPALRPRVLALGNLFRDQLDRYGELESVLADWGRTVQTAPSETLVLNADDPAIAHLRHHAGSPKVLLYGVDDSRHGRPALQHAADSKYCLACGAPYDYAPAYVGHLGDYRCPRCGDARPTLDVAARDITFHGLDGSSFLLATPAGGARVRLAVPGLYNVYNALAAASTALALGASPNDIAAGLKRFSAAFGRFERIEIDGRQVIVLLIKNPAGANEAVRTVAEAAPPKVAVIALNDEIADGRDVSWIWDVDFEPLLDGLEHAIVTGSRAAELALRFAYAGFDRARIEVVAEIETALDRGLQLVPGGEQLIVLPTYTAMLDVRGTIAGRGHVSEYWERVA